MPLKEEEEDEDGCRKRTKVCVKHTEAAKQSECWIEKEKEKNDDDDDSADEANDAVKMI